MKRFPIAALALALLVGAVEAAKLPREAPLRKPDASDERGSEAYLHLRYASQFLQQGLLEQARKECGLALQIEPQFPEAQYLLGLVLFELKDYRGALAQADRILQTNPYFTEAHNLRGLAFGRMGDLDSALRAFEAVKADISFPTPEVAHFNIGKVFWERKAFGEALIHFRRALEINPRWWRAWYLQGDCQEMLGLFDEAKASYAKVIELQPNEAGPIYRTGLICYNSGDLACARMHFTKVLELVPSSDMAAGAREALRQIHFR